MNIAIIPARSGSKRIPKKNIKKFIGKPIITYVIENLKKSKIFDKIYVSTDSNEISKISEANGADVLIRSKKLSTDNVPTMTTINDVIKRLKEKKIFPKYVCIIYSTAIFLNKNHIIDSYKKLRFNKKIKMIFACKKFNHPIERSFKIKNGIAKYNDKEKLIKKTQDFDNQYYDLGQFYYCPIKTLENKKKLILNGTPLIFKNYEALDIDNKEDWHMAEKFFKIKKIN